MGSGSVPAGGGGKAWESDVPGGAQELPALPTHPALCVFHLAVHLYPSLSSLQQVSRCVSLSSASRSSKLSNPRRGTPIYGYMVKSISDNLGLALGL